MENIPQAVRAQIFIARDDYRECFGRDPAGIWLPECAYVSGIDQVLQEANLRWFILDAHGLMYGQPRPRRAIYAPCFTPAGPAAFSRDRESSRQVWSAMHGYPGDPAYRDFYRDIGFELSPEELEPMIAPGQTRKFTGFKYHRITGRTSDKEHYHRVWAMAAADAHAGHFMHERRGQIESLRRVLDVDPIVVAPFDAELFGHWWFEGPEWLELFIRKAVYDQQHVRVDDARPLHQRSSDVADGRAVGVELGTERVLGSVAAREQFVGVPAPANGGAADGRSGARGGEGQWVPHARGGKIARG